MIELVDRVNDYLGNGGLFNPELMENDKVRDLVIDCAQRIEILEAENELLRTVLLNSRTIVCDGAMFGFNPLEGDWAERLYANNGAISAALAGKAVSHD